MISLHIDRLKVDILRSARFALQGDFRSQLKPAIAVFSSGHLSLDLTCLAQKSQKKKLSGTNEPSLFSFQSGRVEKLQRMRWCITEGLPQDFSLNPGLPSAGLLPHFPGHRGDGLLPTPVPFAFGPVPPALQSVPVPNFFPAGANIPHHMQAMGTNLRRGRGPNSRQPVSGLGGQLEVAGVPIARWSGNKAGRGYNDKDRIVVGGPSSVEMGKLGRRGRGSLWSARGKRGGGAGTRNVTWAAEVDKEYDRSIGYVEQPTKPKKATNISQVREGGDGGNDIPIMNRGRGDGGNDLEALSTDGLTTGLPMHGALHPHNLPGQIPGMPQSPQMQFNGQPYSSQSPEMTGLPVGPGLDKAPGGQVPPIILAKPGDIPASLGRGRGVSAGMGGEMPPFNAQSEIVESGGKGRGWWWDKQQQQQQPQQQQPPP